MSRQLKLEIEGEAAFENPSLPHVQSALDHINPARPSFFILGDESGSHVQAAGAQLRLTVEYRELTGFGFRHFVLGRPAEEATDASINYSGGAIRLKTNEILTRSDALEIFGAFYESGTVPDRFSKRDTTEMFK